MGQPDVQCNEHRQRARSRRSAVWRQNSAGQVLDNGGPLSLTNSTLLSSNNAGIRIVGSNPVLTNDVYKNNDIAASMDLGSNPAISGVTLTNNNLNGLRVDGGNCRRTEPGTTPKSTM